MLQRPVAVQIGPERFLHKCVTLTAVLLAHNPWPPATCPGAGWGGEAGLSERWLPAYQILPSSPSNLATRTTAWRCHERDTQRDVCRETGTVCSQLWANFSHSLKFWKWLLDLRLYGDILFPGTSLTEAQLHPHSDTGTSRTASTHTPSKVLCGTWTPTAPPGGPTCAGSAACAWRPGPPRSRRPSAAAAWSASPPACALARCAGKLLGHPAKRSPGQLPRGRGERTGNWTGAWADGNYEDYLLEIT